jgi:hypothetical protein
VGLGGGRHEAFDGREQINGTDGLGNIVVHAGSETAFTIAYHGMSRHGDDGNMYRAGL